MTAVDDLRFPLCTLPDAGPRDSRPGMTAVPCLDAAIAVITFACIHEHVDTPSAR